MCITLIFRGEMLDCFQDKNFFFSKYDFKKIRFSQKTIYFLEQSFLLSCSSFLAKHKFKKKNIFFLFQTFFIVKKQLAQF